MESDNLTKNQHNFRFENYIFGFRSIPLDENKFILE
jgi:hypothetical protein